MRAVKYGSTDALALDALSLASTYHRQGRRKEAGKLILEALETSIKELGPEHSKSLARRRRLADMYTKQCRWKEAEELYMEVLEISTEVLGREHPDTLAISFHLALLYFDLGRYEEAEELEA